ncbi:MAG: FAD-dependent oxidoreductase, partial [Planctomycetia bacterium]
MSETLQTVDVAIVGAGIAGLVAARELSLAGCSVVVLEKSRGVGGRMATRRIGQAVCDHGAQFFTVRGRAFGGIVAEAHDAGAVGQWCDGVSRATANGSGMLPPGDGHPRWRGTAGMTDLPKHMSSALAM